MAAVCEGYKEIGIIGGVPIPPVNRPVFGFIQGVNWAAKEYGVDDINLKMWYANSLEQSPDVDQSSVSDTVITSNLKNVKQSTIVCWFSKYHTRTAEKMRQNLWLSSHVEVAKKCEGNTSKSENNSTYYEEIRSFIRNTPSQEMETNGATAS